MIQDYLHSDYRFMTPRWALTRAILNNEAEKFLRIVDINDSIRQQEYIRGAALMNFTRLTRDGLAGLVFSKATEIQLPDSLQYLLKDATGHNIGLDAYIQHTFDEVNTTGHHGLLAEYPMVGEDEQGEETNYARIRGYSAENIVQWRYKQVGSQYKLAFVAIREFVDVQSTENIFNWTKKVVFRALVLDEDNIYRQYLFNDVFEPADDVKPVTPTDYNGNPFNFIPFTFIGSIDNNIHCNPAPLYDLAVINLAHYRNSADYQESVFLTGQPTIFIAMEGSQQEFEAMYPNGIKIGARGGFNLGKDGKPYLIQANPNQLADQSMKRLEEQAAAIGARLIAPAGAGNRETAEASRIRYGAQNANIYNISNNINLGYGQVLYWMSMYMQEVPEESVIKVNDDYYPDTADPLLIAQQIVLGQNGIIGKSDIRNNLRDVGILDKNRTDEEIDAEVNDDPLVPPSKGGNTPPNQNDGVAGY